MGKRFPKHVWLPREHGAWMMFLAPLVIGVVAGGRWTLDVMVLAIAGLAGFLLRQPLTLWVKARVGRRPRAEARQAVPALAVYGGIALLAGGWLLARGYIFLVFLAVPGLLVLAWYLALVARRSERHQLGLDLVASGILALTAPAALWVARGRYSPEGWWLWAVLWLQAAAAIVYIFARLEQRTWQHVPPRAVRWRVGRRALLYSWFNVLFVALAGVLGWLPRWLWLPYGLQALETTWGTLVAPAVGQRPTRIGLRQLAVYTLFTVLFLLTWL